MSLSSEHLEFLVKSAVSQPRWQLSDGPCWCDMKCEDAAKNGTKIHSGHCKTMKDLKDFIYRNKGTQ